jgi:arsenite methyltransferase
VIPRVLARQLSRPTGLLGALVRRMMNRGNANMNAFALDQLDLASTDRVLEVGFGGGLTLPTLFERAAFVAGIDRSHDVVLRAKAHFAKAVAAGRADFREGQVESLPFAPATFDKVCTVNTVYFWTSLDAGFAELHRVLSPGGRLAVGFLGKERMDRIGFPSDIFTPRTPDDVVASLVKTGFTEVRIARPRAGAAWCVVVAVRAAP